MDIKPDQIFIEEYNYELPEDRIAHFPLLERDRSKLLVYEKGAIKDEEFFNLSQYLPANATLVLNNTKVIEARIFFQKDSGGVIEIFCLEPTTSVEHSMQETKTAQWQCLVGGASKWKHGLVLQKIIQVKDKEVVLSATYISKIEDAFIIEFSWTGNVAFSEVLFAAGNIPLPPYIKRKPVDEDAERYQTVFAKHKGSVAAPTAALHFTDAVFKQLEKKEIHPLYITLHVGAGTFKPVKTETISDHQMHGESFTVTKSLIQALLKSEKIIAVGTTALRTLESLHWLGVKILNGQDDLMLEQWDAYNLNAAITYKESLEAILQYLIKKGEDQLHCRTSLLIVPGYKFKSAQGLITNFHQPKSTLLLLVAAFIGEDWKQVYHHALKNNYRFLSYGDSSLLWRNDQL